MNIDWSNKDNYSSETLFSGDSRLSWQFMLIRTMEKVENVLADGTDASSLAEGLKT